MWGDVGSCGELWGAVRRCEEASCSARTIASSSRSLAASAASRASAGEARRSAEEARRMPVPSESTCAREEAEVRGRSGEIGEMR